MKKYHWLFILLIATRFGYAQTLPNGDDGYRLWLKYDLITNVPRRQAYAQSAQFIGMTGNSAVLKSAADELQTGLKGRLGKSVPVVPSAAGRKGGIVLAVSSGAG